MKKNILLILVLILISSISTSFANSPGTPTVEKKEHIDIGSYDIWLHADGVTWQKNVKPGSTINHNPTIKIPVDDSKNPKNFKVEFVGDFLSIDTKYREYAVNSGNLLDFEYLGNGQLSFKLNTKLISHGNDGRGFDVKEYEWQAGAVEGWRFYIPVKITWEYENQTINTDPKYIYSGFNNRSITHNLTNPHDPRLYTFWMFRPADTSDSVVDEFLIEGHSWTYQGNLYTESEKFPIKHYKLDKDNMFFTYEFYADFVPITGVIWRKGIEQERYTYRDNFKENFWAGYTKEYNGATYYYYDSWDAETDGEFYPGTLIDDYSDSVVQKFLNPLGYTDKELWKQEPWRK